ncbi:hypothetical protein BT96DRAFT_949291 [Gymnopus androsaceus JB14]|uniref:Uncharacterized protein n=1 Tax=Gymnopus androsaceus JB14 TaxID=1447944 RepID=A0A6A4GL75_9AGAR|nr:hypothetical protein BT96DRAFT_949291 [Gymnopus androsaceus JB14]
MADRLEFDPRNIPTPEFSSNMYATVCRALIADANSPGINADAEVEQHLGGVVRMMAEYVGIAQELLKARVGDADGARQNVFFVGGSGQPLSTGGCKDTENSWVQCVDALNVNAKSVGLTLELTHDHLLEQQKLLPPLADISQLEEDRAVEEARREEAAEAQRLKEVEKRAKEAELAKKADKKRTPLSSFKQGVGVGYIPQQIHPFAKKLMVACKYVPLWYFENANQPSSHEMVDDTNTEMQTVAAQYKCELQGLSRTSPSEQTY